MLHNEVASSEKAGLDWVKHACRRMKHFAALPQNMKHRRCGMKQSLFRLHIFFALKKAKKMAEKEASTRAQRVCASIADRRARSAGQPQ